MRSDVLTANRLSIQPLTDEEMRAMIEAETDAELRQAYTEMLTLAQSCPAYRNWYIGWKLTLRESGEMVGDLCFKGPPDETGAVEIGYGILPRFQSRGLCTEAVSRMLDWAFAQNDVRFVEAETEPNNTASRRILEKLGFRYHRQGVEGPRFRHCPERNGDAPMGDAPMKEEALWAAYCAQAHIDSRTPHESWKFCGGGPLADELAALVLSGRKTATSSAAIAYLREGEPLPTVGEYSIVLWDSGEAACIIQTTEVSVTPFSRVDAEHARKEGEGDLSLAFWREAHRLAFTPDYEAAGLPFDPDGDCVCEEFRVVYRE